MYRLVASVIVVACVALAWYVGSSEEEPVAEKPAQTQQSDQNGRTIVVPSNNGGYGSTKFN